MSVGTTGAIIGGAIAAGGAVGGAVISSGAQGDAASKAAAGGQASIAAQQALAQQGLGILKDQNTAAQGLLAPYVAAQGGALAQLQGFTDPNNPLYGQEQAFATRQIQQQLAAQGLLRSRGQGDSLANLQLGLNQQRLGVTQALAGSGAAQQSAAAAQQYGQGAAGILGGLAPSIGSSLVGIGQAQAQGALGQGQAIAGGLAGVGNAFQGAYGNALGYQQYQSQLDLLRQLLGKGGGGGGGFPAGSFLAPSEQNINLGLGSSIS